MKNSRIMLSGTSMTQRSRREYRTFGWMMGAVITVLFGLALPWVFDKGMAAWPFVLGFAFAGTACFAPMALAPVYRVWMTFGHYAGWINTRIILGIAFLLLFTPIALFFRLTGRDALQRRSHDDGRTSYWHDSETPTREQMKRMY